MTSYFQRRRRRRLAHGAPVQRRFRWVGVVVLSLAALGVVVLTSFILKNPPGAITETTITTPAPTSTSAPVSGTPPVTTPAPPPPTTDTGAATTSP